MQGSKFRIDPDADLKETTMTSKTSLRLMALCAVLAAAAPLAACDNSSSGTTPDRTYPQDRAMTAPVRALCCSA